MKFATFNASRRAIRALFTAGVAVAGVAAGSAAMAADGTGTASATVVRPIAIANSSPNLRFGSFSTAAAGQTVTLGTDGTRTLGGGALAVGTGQNAFGAASFAVSGEGSLTYAITLPTSTTISTGDGLTGKTMTVSDFVSNPSGTGTLSGTAGTAGTQNLLVGAKITTVASQVSGVYTGTFTVTVAYN